MSETLPFHPLANLFPLIEGEAFAELCEDIAANGLREPIILLDGAILDGRNRYRAGLKVGLFEPAPSRRALKLWFRDHDEALDGPALAFVLSRNLHRRHLSESQRAMVAAKLEGFRHGGSRAGQDANLQLDGSELSLAAVTRAEAAEIAKVSPRSVASARAVLDHGAPELARKVEAGEVAVSVAAELARLSTEEQREVILSAEPLALYKAVKVVRDKRQAEKKAKRAEREQQLGEKIASGNAALVAAGAAGKRYGVVLADPEWRFEVWSAETGMDRAADNHYPTSPVEVIASRPVAEIAADDCVLLLWATVPALEHALAVMKAWGFTYKSHAAWLKDAIGTGYWFRNQHEILLLGTRGNPPAPAMGTQFRSALAFPAGEHSAKPPFAHEIAEAYFPTLPKIELNARKARAGWDVWGAEAPEGGA